MRKILSFLLMALFSVGMWAKEGGTLTSTTTPIDPTQTVTLTYDGTGTNFANWTPLCYIHTWLVPANEQTFSKDYGTTWATCNGDGDYDALDAKVKMTYAGTAGKYTISMNIKEFFGVAEADLAKIAKIGVIVRAQYSGDSNQTNDFFLNVSASGEEPEPAIIKMHGNFFGGDWADTKDFALAGDKKTATLAINLEKGKYEFGVKVDGTWTSNGVAFTRENNSAEVVAGSGNLTLDADTKGEYTFTWTYATKELSIEYPEYVASLPVMKIAGSWNVKDEAWVLNEMNAATDEKTASYEVSLEKGVYDFKVIKDGQWKTKANGGDPYGLHREWPGVAGVKDNATENLQVTVDKAGTHTFTWTYANDSIGIAFPELVSSTVTVTAPEHGTITVKNGEEVIGEKVQEGTILTVNAASKDAATYDIINLRAYKTEDPETTVEITDGKLTMPAYPITITADEKEVVYQTIYFVNKDGWETVKAYVYLDEDHQYKEWPGEAMTKTEEKAKGKDIYSYRFPAKYTKIIFNDGGENQTENHSWIAAKPYICNGLDYAKAEDVVLDAKVKYYIVGNAEAMGAWDPTAVPSAAEECVIANLPAGDYKFRLSLDGTWENTKGFSDLKEPVTAGLKAGDDNNICFTLKEASDVTITYNETAFTVTGKFYVRVPVLKDLMLVPGVWAEGDAKIAAWIWTKKEGHEMEDQWTAFFAPKSAGNDTLTVKLDAEADSIVFARFNSTAEAPSWEDKEDFRWNSLASDTIDKINLTYTITGWSEGTWDPYIPAKYYLTGDSALVVDAGFDKDKTWHPDAIKVTEDTYVFANLKKGQEYRLKATLNGEWETTKAYAELTAKALGLKTDGDNNIIFRMANNGNVTVTLTDKVFTVEGDFAMPTVAIAGNVTGWSPIAMKLAEDKLSASVTFENLAYGVDSFKIVLDGNWISKNGEGESFYTFHRGWNEDKDIKGGDRNMILDRDKAGNYTFTWVYANDSLHIAFPELVSSAVTVTALTNGTITVKNGEDAISAPVKEGTVLTVTAAANDPAVYEIKNLRAYKTGEETVEVAITDGKLIMPAYPITITANEEKIVYQTLYFVDKEGWNGVNAYVFVDEHAVYRTWPGEAMKKEDRKVKEKDLYSYTFPAKYTKIIFNKKDQAETQTGDMLWNAATPYYCNGFWYESEEAVVLDATAKYYITGDNALMGNWNPAAVKAANDSYTFSNLPAGTYRMKVTLEGTWEEGKVKGYSDLTVKDPGFTTNGDNDIIFKLNEPGDVTVTYNATTFTVTGNFAQKEYYIAGSFTNWAKEMVKMTKKDDKYAATIEIKATEVQEFKVVYVFGADSVWYGLENPATMTSADGEWEIGGGEANIGLKPTKAGDYTFTFNPEVPSLTVEMPAQGGGTALDNIEAAEKARKVIIDGQLLILYNERMYNIQGQTVK